MIKLCAVTDEAGVNIDDIIKAFRNMGVHVCEIREVNGKGVLELSESEAQEIYNKLKEKQIEVWSIASPIGRNDLAIDFAAFGERVKKAITLAKIFNAPHIRVFSFLEHNNNEAEVIKRLQYVVTEAGKENIKVCLENHHGCFADTPDKMIALLDKIPGLLSVYDAGNYVAANANTDDALTKALPRAHYVHVKDGAHINGAYQTTPPGEGEANFASILKGVGSKDMPFSIEHRLATPKEGETFEQVQGAHKFAYPNKMAAFFDAVGHLRMLLLKAGYMEIHEGLFKK